MNWAHKTQFSLWTNVMSSSGSSIRCMDIPQGHAQVGLSAPLLKWAGPQRRWLRQWEERILAVVKLVHHLTLYQKAPVPPPPPGVPTPKHPVTSRSEPFWKQHLLV